MGRKAKYSVGDRVFGLIREARDGQPISSLVDAAIKRDLAVNDVDDVLNPSQFTINRPDKTNIIQWNNHDLIESANSQLAKMVGLTDKQIVEFDPDIIKLVLDKHLPHEAKKIRLYKSNGSVDVVRAFVSTDYTHIPSTDFVQNLINENQDRLNSLKITHIYNGPEYLGADVIDTDQGFDTNQLGDPGPVPENIVFPGYQFNINDLGLATASLSSYLWVLVCNNGSAIIDAATRLRAIHKGNATVRGQLIAAADWKNIVLDAKSEFLKNVGTNVAVEKMKKLAQRPPMEILSDVWDRVEMNQDKSIYTRYALAQAFGDTANRVPNNIRRNLQDISGQLLTNKIEKVFPVLESVLV